MKHMTDTTMKKRVSTVLGALLLAAFSGVGMASGGAHLEAADVDLNNQASLQRGAKYFANYCMNCHSAEYMRFGRLGRDLGLDEGMLKDNLMFVPGIKVGETMQVAMPKSAAAEWFGTPPPDLSLVARSRGADWLNTYLKSFYTDEERTFGVNNLVFKEVGMPHVLEGLQGVQKPVYHTEEAADGSAREVIDHLELVSEGSLTPAEYNQFVRDLVTFLVYLGEPAQLERRSIGHWVLLFMLVFTVLAYLLKLEFWKDLH
jgi:ubiquinol-cytochrome c reductase cytochrome c1 subunit